MRFETAPQLVWQNAERPMSKWTPERATGNCATCGAILTEGVPTSAINNPTFSQHADFWRYGTHCCPACAWLYAAGKGKPGNLLAYGDRLEYLVISTVSVVPDKRPWLVVLPELLSLPPETPLTGVLTTDVKPRVWPRMVLSSVGAPVLMTHAPEYDLSAPVAVDLAALLDLTQTVCEALTLGYTKLSVFRGLTRDYPRFVKNMEVSNRLEQTLRPLRQTPEFVPALVMAQKGESNEPSRNAARKPEPCPDTRHQFDEAQPGLF